jgi:hypothetical protein
MFKKFPDPPDRAVGAPTRAAGHAFHPPDRFALDPRATGGDDSHSSTGLTADYDIDGVGRPCGVRGGRRAPVLRC